MIAAPKTFLPDCANLGTAPNWAHIPYYRDDAQFGQISYDTIQSLQIHIFFTQAFISGLQQDIFLPRPRCKHLRYIYYDTTRIQYKNDATIIYTFYTNSLQADYIKSPFY
jgi:hypothetical protein